LAEVSVFVYDTSSPHPVSLLGNFTTNGGKVVLAVPVGTSIFAVASSQYHRDTQTPIVTVPEEGLKVFLVDLVCFLFDRNAQDHLNQVNVQMVNLGWSESKFRLTEPLKRHLCSVLGADTWAKIKD
jgi:hypothetical protein